jgi:gamma-glutamylputrescine oxidase
MPPQPLVPRLLAERGEQLLAAGLIAAVQQEARRRGRAPRRPRGRGRPSRRSRGSSIPRSRASHGRYPVSIACVDGSYWLDAEPPFRPPAARGGGRVDVAIVGAGITGCAAALRLARAGARVRLYEARVVAGGASGRSGGFLLRGGAERYDLARERLGRDGAQAYWRWSEGALDRLTELGGDAVRRSGSVRLAADERERDAIRAEYDALREDGFDAEWRDDAPRGFHGAVVHPRDGAFQPVRLVRRLVTEALAVGAELSEGARVEDVDALDAERVLVATDGLGRGLEPELDNAIVPVRNQVLLTAPLDERPFPRPHYARYGHAYWQQLQDGRLLLGGFRDVDAAAEETDEEGTSPTVQAALESFLRDELHVEAPVERRWSGIFGVTTDLLPLAGRLPGPEHVWVAAGYSGHGNVLGLACGEAVADAMLGSRDPLLDLLDPARFVRGGPAR